MDSFIIRQHSLKQVVSEVAAIRKPQGRGKAGQANVFRNKRRDFCAASVAKKRLRNFVPEVVPGSLG